MVYGSGLENRRTTSPVGSNPTSAAWPDLPTMDDQGEMAEWSKALAC